MLMQAQVHTVSSAAPTGGEFDVNEDEDCCVICLDALKAMPFLPCGHMVRPPVTLPQHVGAGQLFLPGLACIPDKCRHMGPGDI